MVPSSSRHLNICTSMSTHPSQYLNLQFVKPSVEAEDILLLLSEQTKWVIDAKDQYEFLT
jgi:hypothetical protein